LEKLRNGLDSLFKHAGEWTHSITLITMPSASSSVAKRSVSSYYGANGAPKKSHQARSVTPQSPPSARDNSDFVTGILPAYFTSEADCNKTTNHCSHRGSCQPKYKSPEGSDEDSMFHCVCEAVKEKTSRGTKTIYFGGPACQKKDIVMPFWLLTGLTIFLTSAIFWGVGLMYSVGSEELPSVIGAGVSGPKAR
jgi:hypothetical protein